MSMESKGPTLVERISKLLLPIVLVLTGYVSSYVVTSIRADERFDSDAKALNARVAALEERQSQMVTKEQFVEVVRRLDEKTDTTNKKLDQIIETLARRRP